MDNPLPTLNLMIFDKVFYTRGFIGILIFHLNFLCFTALFSSKFVEFHDMGLSIYYSIFSTFAVHFSKIYGILCVCVNIGMYSTYLWGQGILCVTRKYLNVSSLSHSLSNPLSSNVSGI